MARILRASLVGLLVLLLAAGGIAVYLVRRPFPQVRGTVRVPGLHAPVEVVRDRWGVPHIYARTSHDLFFAQGYVHAQDRLWQMELFRRLAAGRLAELFGPAALEADRLMRVIGLRRTADAIWRAGVSDESAAALRAYSAGVNAFLRAHRGRLPLEFTLLRVRPQPWSPVDTLAFARFMAWVLGGNWRQEVLQAALEGRFGPGAAAALLPREAPGAPVITAPGGEGARGGVPWGSNSWVVGPRRSAGGGALLANDPHLEAQMPAIWYTVHLVGGPYDVIGASFAGTPGVVIGHNRHIAWGLTNANPDVQDLYIERFHPEDPDRYLYRGTWLRARVVREVIRVRGRALPEVLTVRITRHGPVLNPAVRHLPFFLALRWTGHDPDDLPGAVLRLNRARTWQEFRAALRGWTVPAQNVVYADRQGNIGYVMPGRVPVRPPGATGLRPVPGWTGAFEWRGFIPEAALPALFNPPRGFIVTANNRVAPSDYPYYLGDDFDVGFRALRITRLLEGAGRLDLEAMARIQQDQTDLLARRFVAAWQGVRLADPDLRALFQEVQRWDGTMAPHLRAPLLYHALLHELLAALFRDTLDRDLFARYLRAYDAPLLVLLRLSGRPHDPWWGPGGRDRAVEEALRRAVETLGQRYGRDRARWTWGRAHTPTFTHPLGRVRGLGWVFNARPPATGGSAFTVNMGAYSPEEPFRQVAIPSYRFLVDTRTWEARAMHSTGQSGLPFHRHYRDFAGPWARGAYHPLLTDRRAIDAATEGTLRLQP